MIAHSIQESYVRASALRDLTQMLAQAQQREQAEVVARSIEESSHRTKASSELARALAQAQRWEQAETIWAEAESVARSIEGSYVRANALMELTETYPTAKGYVFLLGIVQRVWLLAETREYVLELFPLAFGLIPAKPDIGGRFYEAFEWVNAFLNG